MKWSELNLNNLVPLANILRLIVVKLSFVVKGLLSDETKVLLVSDELKGVKLPPRRENKADHSSFKSK